MSYDGGGAGRVRHRHRLKLNIYYCTIKPALGRDQILDGM